MARQKVTSESPAKRVRKAPAVDDDEMKKLAFMARQIDEEHREEPGPPAQPGRLRNPPEADLGARIRDARETKFITQGELADLTKSLDADEKGISRAVISLYEKGVNRPSPKELRLLCEALRVTPNHLIYGDEHPFDTLQEYERLGTLDRKTPEGYAWLAYIMANIHHNHYDAVMKLVLDLERGWNKQFDIGLQDRANAEFLVKAEELKRRLELRAAEKAEKPKSIKR